MKALILSAWEDTGGVGIALKKAMERWTDWEVRVVHRHYNYIEYETDIYWEPGTPKPSGLDALFRQADVIHVMERWSAVDQFDGWRDKPLVMHHHGTEFRVDNTANLLRTVKEYAAVPIVSTIDLRLLDQSAEWLPNPVDIPAMASLRSAHGSPSLRVAHSPTNRALKATDLFLSCTERLPYNVDLIEWMPWKSGLRLKGLADVVFDQLFIGYALSGIEAMAMGIPVVGGAGDRRIYDLMLAEFGYLPFLAANEETLCDRLEDMLSPKVRSIYSELGLHHVSRYHAEEKVAVRLSGIWERAMGMR